MPQARAAVILAAGLGVRMQSQTPKCLHRVGGRTLLDWTIALARSSGVERIVVVHGAKSEAIAEAAKAAGCEAVLQDPPLGTGHAVLCARDAFDGFDGSVIVLYGDTPLVRPESVEKVFAALDAGASVGVLGFEAVSPGAYGRLVVGESGGLERIVEAKDATPEELQISLCNSGVVAAPAGLLFDLLPEVKNRNAKGEYYLTDIVGLARARGLSAAVVQGDEVEMLGVNCRADLAAAEASFQRGVRAKMMAQGVTLAAPDTVFFSFDTEIAADVIVEPNVVFGPKVRVEEGAVIHAFSHIEGARVGPSSHIGPFARLRPGADIGAKARVGNFVEVKQTTMGEGAKANHLAYLGDAEIGAGANIGAGSITCNYDGFDKHRTVIGEGAFIGSNTALVAPVKIGKGAYTGSGGVITDNVPDDALVIARAKQEVKKGWAAGYRAAKQARMAKKDLPE